ncbi:exodeoxyribonuclease I [Salicola sp. Rm-C-2C1-2]|uniref:exodeoxyribonuclease I n=1 Tax=Salicola sp. Rm-C-2C1-2 TaxID=3141321 RepID=UPI0032E414BA
MQSFFWHDYETFGADPIHDRPAQFAGVRTDPELNIIEDPVTLYARPAEDFVPDPVATLVTGITPQDCLNEGLPEAEFIQRINDLFMEPGTCAVGYNSLRFDDEVTRHTLYRNLRDPYAREWHNGNSRWDIIDMVRLAHAVRPEGIEWPRHEDGRPSFRLEDLTAANGINHGEAHDAMADVYATIEVARLIRNRQPKLFDYVLNHRSKRSVLGMLDTERCKPVLHVSSMYPSEQGCCALVAPVAAHPINRNSVIVFDLRQDPRQLEGLSPEGIREQLFKPADERSESDGPRPALKEIRANTCPVVAPAALLKDLSEQRLQHFGLDRDRLRANLNALKQMEGLADRLQKVYGEKPHEEKRDPDEALYSGGFIKDADRRELQEILETPPGLMGELEPTFEDSRLPELFFRYRARNYPQSLSADEQERWEQFRQQRLMDPGSGWRSLPGFFEDLQQRMADSSLSRRDQLLLQDLQFYGESLIPSL